MVPSLQNMKTCGVIPKQSTQLSSRGRQPGLQLEHTSKLQTSTRLLGCAVMSWAVLTSHMLALPLHPTLLALPHNPHTFPTVYIPDATSPRTRPKSWGRNISLNCTRGMRDWEFSVGSLLHTAAPGGLKTRVTSSTPHLPLFHFLCHMTSWHYC